MSNANNTKKIITSIGFKSLVPFGADRVDEWSADRTTAGGTYTVEDRGAEFVFTPKGLQQSGAHKGKMQVVRVFRENVAFVLEVRDAPPPGVTPEPPSAKAASKEAVS